MKEQFVIPAKLKTISIVLLAIGLLALILGLITLSDPQGEARFWSVLMFNGIFFMLIAVGALVVLCAATLAQGSWHIAYKRVIEAMVMALPVLGIVAFIVMMCVVWGDKYHIYEWVDKNLVANDHLLQKKSAFLNPAFYSILTIVTIGIWSLLGFRLRKLSLQEDLADKGKTKIL